MTYGYGFGSRARRRGVIAGGSGPPLPTYLEVENFENGDQIFTAGSPALPPPAGTEPGDLLVAVVTRKGGVAAPSTPSGWTLIDHWLFGPDTASGARVSLFWRIAPDPVPASWTFTISGVYAYGRIFGFRNFDETDPIGTSIVHDTLSIPDTGDQSETMLAVQTDTPNAMSLLFVVANLAGAFTWQDPDPVYTAIGSATWGGNFVAFRWGRRLRQQPGDQGTVEVKFNNGSSVNNNRTLGAVRISISAAEDE